MKRILSNLFTSNLNSCRSCHPDGDYLDYYLSCKNREALQSMVNANKGDMSHVDLSQSSPVETCLFLCAEFYGLAFQEKYRH